MSDTKPTAPKPEPRVWVAYMEGRGNEAGTLVQVYVRTSERDALRLAVDHGLEVKHVPRSAELVAAVLGGERDD